MRVQNVGINNHRKQQNFTSVVFRNPEIKKVSAAGVRSLLEEMEPDIIDCKTMLNALRQLVALDRRCSPNGAFEVEIAACSDGLNLYARPAEIDRPFSIARVHASPSDKFEPRLLDTYMLLKAPYISTNGTEGISLAPSIIGCRNGHH